MTILIRPLQEHELPIAAQIMRLAFGTFVGAPNLTEFFSDLNYMNRWYADPQAAFAAEDQGQIIGSNIAINWGSFGLFGPLTVHPDYWDKGIGQRLIEPAIACFERWGTTQNGFFTFPNSPKHLKLYQRFGFHPRSLTALMSKTVSVEPLPLQGLEYSQLPPSEQAASLKACFELTHTLYDGLDLSREISTVAAQNLGETILLWDDTNLVGFAVCHCGAGTEAGTHNCYIKFGAVRSGAEAEANFERLLQNCEALAAKKGLSSLNGGVNTERYAAYYKMQSLGFRIEHLGLAMHQPNQPGFNRPDVFAIDDWR
ncbi:MAG: GNAT family N-acetyltransferase [Oscillatoriophycideae cyanobacterium NC_groundwater_1537_Pr4_S-0.65um_50_18]|nr:GNAT family N-acetyltransferase [Oscillatoriophycideae cyanobacterium NC_groundwater_1537_Pr4_S-0.65um_50_18]